MSTDLEKLHTELVENLKEKLGQKGQPIITGWSIRDCLDNSNTKELMQDILALRRLMERYKP